MSNSNLQRFMGRRIRNARERLGLTQAELAAQIGKTQQVISNYEKGSRAPRIEDLPQLAEKLGVPLTHFFFDPEVDEQLLAAARALDPVLLPAALESLKAYASMRTMLYNLSAGGGFGRPIEMTVEIDPQPIYAIITKYDLVAGRIREKENCFYFIVDSTNEEQPLTPFFPSNERKE